MLPDLLGGNAHPTANLQAAPVKLDVLMADITAPVHQAGTPRVEALNGDYLDLIVKLDEAGSAYYTVDAYSANTPMVGRCRLNRSNPR